MKRIISVLMLVCMLASFCTVSAFAEGPITSQPDFEAAIDAAVSGAAVIELGEGDFTMVETYKQITIKGAGENTRMSFPAGYSYGDNISFINVNTIGGTMPIDDLGGGAGGTEPGAGSSVSVSTLADLQAALADSSVTSIRLTQKIDITSDTTIDGNGKTVTFNGTDDRAIVVTTSGVNLTVKNLTLVGHANRAINYNTTGKLTLEKVTIKGDNNGDFTYVVNLPSGSSNSQVEINNCNISGIIPLNIWGENLVANVNNSSLKCIDKNGGESYAAIALCKNSTGDAANAVVNVNGGSITATGDSAAIAISSTNGKVNVSGATVTGPTIMHVAYIEYTGDNSYAFTSLAAAIKQATKDGSTEINLMRDVDMNGQIVDMPANITVNNNGFKLLNGGIRTEGTDTVEMGVISNIDTPIQLAAGTTVVASLEKDVFSITKAPGCDSIFTLGAGASIEITDVNGVEIKGTASELEAMRKLVSKDYCVSQGSIIIRASHDLNGTVCKVCGVDTASPKTGSVPVTGDMSNMPLWTLLFVGFAAVAVLTRKKKA